MNNSTAAEKHSEMIFWIIQTVFGVVIADSFGSLSQLLIPPFIGDLLTSLLAFIAVYSCILLSWVDYSYSVIVSPYSFRGNLLERLRFILDFLIVFLYCCVLKYLPFIQAKPWANLGFFFLTFSLIYLGYLLVGFLRIQTHGRASSKINVILFFFVLYLIAFFVYHWLQGLYGGTTLNRLFLLTIIALNLSFRVARNIASKRKLNLGVDVDGVLSDQISTILPVIRDLYGVHLSHCDIVDWRLRVGPTTIDKVIVSQQRSEKYVLNQEAIIGAALGISQLITRYRVCIITSRDPLTNEWTKRWLRMNRIHFDEFYSQKDGTKSHLDHLNILIDDYDKNVLEFLQSKPERKAIIFAQPWNQHINNHHLTKYQKQGRLVQATSWEEIPGLIERLTSEINPGLTIPQSVRSSFLSRVKRLLYR
jgi:5'(3')-deoxyribonucleotidase